MEPTTNSASGKITAALVIGLLVGFSAGVFWQERRASIPIVPTDALTKTLQSDMMGADARSSTSTISVGRVMQTGVPARNIVVKDQSAGDRVEIENIDASEILWVAVREEKDGVPGNILGAQKVFAGAGQKVTVELLRPTISGGAYRVMLYNDVGDPAFNYREDVAVEGVGVRFLAR